MKTSKFVIDNLDRGIMFGCGWISGEEETDLFSAGTEGKKELTENLAEMLPDDLNGIPAWLKFAFSASMIYGTAIASAFSNLKTQKT